MDRSRFSLTYNDEATCYLQLFICVSRPLLEWFYYLFVSERQIIGRRADDLLIKYRLTSLITSYHKSLLLLVFITQLPIEGNYKG